MIIAQKTRRVLLAYLQREHDERPIREIVRYMQARYGVRPGTTRQALSRLFQAGAIDRPDHGYYGAWHE